MRTLARCRRGAVMVIGLFASALLIGMVSALYGLGQAIRYGETTHDAADAAAFAAAVVDARALNLVALFNLTRLAVTAVGVTTGAVSLAATATAAFIRQTPALAFALPAVTAVGLDAGNRQARNQPLVAEILAAVAQGEQAIAAELPDYRDQVADEIVKQHGRRAGFVAPPTALPLVPEPKAAFCARVLPFVAPNRAFDPLPAGAVRDFATAAFAGNVLPLCLQSPVTSTRLAPGTKLGTEIFQRRGYALAAPLPLGEEAGVRIASWGASEGGGEVPRLREQLSEVGLAQAEAYFDGAVAGADPAAEMLWHLGWRARMRRYRDQDDFGEFAAGCARRGGGAACGTIAQALATGKELLVH